MSPSNLLPTPINSTDITGKDCSDMESAFVLPPPAITARARSSAMQASPPASPLEKPMGGSLQRKRTLSGTAKSKSETGQNSNVDLPPPPSRARKIIQMKPKHSISDDQASPPAVSKSQASAKRKQPSATSAAGRKIARKTAHSIIERRRRSKMNEEFGVLKDMIPACKGVEMHKLAILQAGIEYVRYLQGCVEQLQDHKVEEQFEPQSQRQSSSLSDESVRYRGGSIGTVTTASTNASPALLPQRSSQLEHRSEFVHPPTNYSTSPPPMIAHTSTPTGVSPAFNAIHFSPDLTRSSNSQQVNISGKPSPNILPLPQAALPMNSGREEDVAEATATAALMMLTNDRRGPSRGAMSVKELLSG